MKTRLLISFVGIVILMGVVWGGVRVARLMGRDSSPDVPTTRVKRGRVTITVTARGELQGGNSEVLTAPMSGGGDMAITSLRAPGEFVKTGDVVAQFDTTQQDFNLREAEADLAEAEQQVIKAKADADATLEEARYQMLSTAADVKQAELEVRKNTVLAAVTARQNEIALEAARNRQQQAQHDFNNKKTSADAGIDIQKAAVQKARAASENAQRTIDSMVLKAKTGGYVNVQQNSNQNRLYYGQQLPPFQVGDSARAGQAVAQIPDMRNWEVNARIPESDRGYLEPGQKVTIRAAAIAGREFKGHVKSVGAATGSAWDRSFECRIALDEAAPELRPGMTSNILITVQSLDDVLWVPSQALFNSGGRSFVYVRSPDGFVSKDVQLVRRSESQAVIAGIDEGAAIALSNPGQQSKSSSSGGVMKALQK
jgi:multidrug efflux pump subunit AcrA (membrane-fusion protein)